MTRIALLGPANSIHLQRWAHALVERGHAVCVLSQHVCERRLLPEQANVFLLPRSGSLGYFTNAWRARELLTQWRPDVLNAHYASGYGTTAALCGVRPVLLSVWGSDVYDFPVPERVQGPADPRQPAPRDRDREHQPRDGAAGAAPDAGAPGDRGDAVRRRPRALRAPIRRVDRAGR